jgi:predicted MFS family arabinose efflux permease
MRRSGLWRNSDFVHLWGAATVSNFGSVVSGTTLPFAAILLLHASPAAISGLLIAELLPAFLFGLLAGAWVDRVRRGPIMIGADLARAMVLLTIPLAAIAGSFNLAHIYLVTALVSALSVFFDVAYQSYLPSVVRNDVLIEANSKISGAASVAEAAGFSSAGWLIQLLSAPLAIVVDALTFLASAGLIARMPSPETRPQRPPDGESAASIRDDVLEGLGAVWHQPILRGLVAAGMGQNLAYGFIGTVYLLYVNQEVGFSPGILGLIFAVGGISSLLGAMIAGRLNRFGIGAVMVGSLVLAAFGEALTPLATVADAVGIVLLVGQQLLGDAALTVFEINQVSLRQAIAPPRALGRVNASVRVTEFGALLAGTVGGGCLGETIGLRGALWLGVAASLLAALALALSPAREVKRIPAAALEAAA